MGTPEDPSDAAWRHVRAGSHVMRGDRVGTASAREGAAFHQAHRRPGQLVLMSATTKIALGVTAGYLLGRMRKLRLAITVGGLLAGQRVATNPQALLAQGNKLIDNNAE